MRLSVQSSTFLSIQAQDFIEELTKPCKKLSTVSFLSIQAQDFIEESPNRTPRTNPAGNS